MKTPSLVFWDPTKEPLPENPNYRLKISMCITCMDRLGDLQQTLPKNIKENSDYPNVEFVLLDYNSKDNLGDWIKNNMMQYIESGILNYYRTEEPKFYSMTHSRNVAFKLARGDIVNSVDADNFTNPGFATYLNKMAQIAPNKAVFAKGRRLLHGRIGFYKSEFIELLGGYDEDIHDYGHDDKDLWWRAMLQGWKLMWFGGQFVSRIKTPRGLKTVNMKDKNWKKTETENKEISAKRLSKNIFIANQGKHWGKATVIKNFKEEISI